MSQHPDFKPATWAGVLTGRKFLLYLGAFFFVVIGANIIMSYYALSTFDGVETENAYKRGRAYNDVLAAAKAQEERGWSLDISHSVAGALDTTFLLTMQDRNGAPVSGLDLSLALRRPVAEGKDQALSAVETRPGTYEAVLTLPAPGNWLLDISARRQGELLYAEEKRVFLTAESASPAGTDEAKAQ
mgnify:CR=1 FL=1